jgi:leucyl-tRNA synthetase
MDPKNKKALVDKKEVSYWGEVDVYVGGAEHATGHLLYSRFWHKFLKDISVVKTEEPFLELHNQGLILADDGRKMSKRWGNVINPDEIVKNYGADTLRVYEMFMGPFTDSIAWSTESIIGSRRFIERVWRLGMKVAEQNTKISGVREKKALHKLIKKVTEDIPLFGFNTAVSSMMICLNEWEKEGNINKEDFKKFLQLLAPFAPHMTEELWQELGEKKSIHLSGWPKYDPKLLIEDTVTVVVQVNGKLRGTLSLPKDTTEAQAVLLAKEDKDVARHLDGMEIVKAIFIPNKLLNFVVKN